MESSFPIAHKKMLAYEGGYSNHPADPGGVTLQGVIQTVYDDYRRSKGLPKQALTRAMLGTPEWIAERDDIYRSRYWNPPRCGQLDPGVDAAIYDYSVNSGIGRSRKVLQRLVGVPVTGVVDQATIDAANKRDAKVLVGAICNERLAFLKQLKTWPVFGVGWGNRVADVRSYSTKLAEQDTANIPLPIVAQEPAGKGEVPDPKGAKAAAGGTLPAGATVEAVRDGAGWWDWIQGHPFETGLIVLGLIAAVGLGIAAINRWRQTRQEAPIPGIDVVPEKTP